MTSSAIDPERFAELQQTAGADFVVELVEAFLEEAPGMLAELRTARADGDAERFRRAAHSLKSNSFTFGAQKLGDLARELELRGLDADPTGDTPRIDAIDAEFALAAGELRRLRHG